MTCRGITCNQGRKPCKTPHLCQCNHDRSDPHDADPFAWIDELAHKASVALLRMFIVCAVITVYVLLT
jgi:hypothetical protein